MSRFSPYLAVFRQLAVSRRPATLTEDQTPLRAELFSADQMEQHGRALGKAHVLSSATRDHLLQRLDENEEVLVSTRDMLTAAIRANSRVAPAAEWLLDNFYLIEEEIRTARQHLPKTYSRELPRLAEGPSAGLPRVYDLALAAIAHSDGRVDAETLHRFVAAYQTVTSLTLGELWAIPIMLRLALIENLRRVSARLATARQHVNQAQQWADLMVETAGSDPKSLILVIADMARSNPPMLSPFVAELTRRLQGLGPALALPLTWIEHRLAEASLTIEQLVLAENQQLAADQVSISSSIGSLRLLGAIDWQDFVEVLSGVEQILRLDPHSVYPAMDFATRDRYRHVIGRVTRYGPGSELDVARAALELSRTAAAGPDDDGLRSHVGYYLIGQGLPQLEAAIGARLPAMAEVRRYLARFPLGAHLGGMLVLTLAFAMSLLLMPAVSGVSAGWLLLMLIPALLGASQLAISLVNWLATLFKTPDMLPRMDYRRGLPEDMRTLVVVPTLLGAGNIDALLEDLEVRFLGNQDPYLHFGLLTDFRDADAETLPDDATLLLQIQEGIARLNEKYRGSSGGNFCLFHRPRRWNPVDRIWMGHERKRGKLADLNALLRGGVNNFALVIGVAQLRQVRYVITLDTDTQLARDTARHLVETMAHPLNRPRIDHAKRLVTRGYGILQPGMAASLTGTRRSRYARLCSSEPGIDPYTRQVSDVYQDLFCEGSFIGKGIYDVDAFEFVLAGRFPENRILSHDLLEGCYARSGLISDVRLYEDCPPVYSADISRQRRWIRGDWQIARWLLPRVPDGSGGLERNPLSALSRWKILDNLRRSLVPAAMLLLLLLGWRAGEHPWVWTLVVAGSVVLIPLLSAGVSMFRKAGDVFIRQHLINVMRSVADCLLLAGFRLVMLPYEALTSLDAIARAKWRLLVSKRGLLEWSVVSAREQHGYFPERQLFTAYLRMWIAPMLALATLLMLWQYRPQAVLPALPLLGLWVGAPALAWWVSRPLEQPGTGLGTEQLQFLRGIARKTWDFFEQFVTAADNWLPPDNFQEQPGPIIAHRTSPTNIGLALLANLSAFDFGYIPASGLLVRTGDTLRTLGRLERYLGHFYNWYDTESLQPLPPRYISSVDSGNFAAHLLILREGLLGLAEQKIVSPQLWQGLSDSFAVYCEILTESFAGTPSEAVRQHLVRVQSLLQAATLLPPIRLPAVLHTLVALETASADLSRAASASAAPEPDAQVGVWAGHFAEQCRAAKEDLLFLAPWLSLAAGAVLVLNRAPALVERHHGIPTLYQLATHVTPLVEEAVLDSADLDEAQRTWLQEWRRLQVQGGEHAAARIAMAEQLARQAVGFAEMEYEFLYDPSRRLLAIGYNVDEFRRDGSFYDLLASEARLASFVAIAQGQLPQESWFAMSRLLTTAGGQPVLVSWSGSMFEYLMPMLVMPAYENTLLEQTCRAAVARQIDYGRQRGLPWGISESGYNTTDASLNYQYHAFGVPGLGLKRGLTDDLVIAPYATALALMVAPEAACNNLLRLTALGVEGRYGYYEAVDYTPARLGRGQSSVIVRSYMAHHQGMSLLALGHLLLARPMQRRFEAEPMFQATLLLLQERIPATSLFHHHAGGDTEKYDFDASRAGAVHAPLGAVTPTPEVQLLSNGRYHVMLTNAGGGYSRWKDVAITRWREDATRDHWGSFIYLRDEDSGVFWSATHQPVLKKATSYEALFTEGRAEYRRRDEDIETYTEVVVSPEDDVELRRLRLTNRSKVRRVIEVTSYAEVVLAPPAADAMQTTFGNLFVQTELIPDRRAILCTRRPRSASEQPPCVFHLLAVNGATLGEVSFETDRMRFIGRGRTLAAPQAMDPGGTLAGSQGSVLDPIVAIRCRVALEPRQSLSLDLVSGIGKDTEVCMVLIERYQDRHLADRAFDLAGSHGAVTLRQINASEADARLYQRLAGAILYAGNALRADASVLLQNRRGQSGLWGYSISGDLPILLLKISSVDNIGLARQLIQCHAYWRLKGLLVDLVIWNEDHVGYRQTLHDQIMGLIATGSDAHALDRPAGIFVRSGEQISHEDRILFQSVARAIIDDSQGTLAEQLGRRGPAERRVARLVPVRAVRPEPLVVAADTAEPAADNGIGGFSVDGSEYLITTLRTQRTPLPWVNVLANPGFGSVVTESGQAYTWSENAHENRITPWSDDAVGASAGEAFYLRDEDSGQFWSPTPLPCPGNLPYVTRHGFGYSVFEHTTSEISSEMSVYVDLERPVKFIVIKISNNSARARKLSVTGYVEWVLGNLRTKTGMHVVTEIDASSGALFARNCWNSEFPGRVAFFDVDDPSRTLTGDRGEFLGRTGTPMQPDALLRMQLSGRIGAGLDPCGAIQVPFELAAGQQRDIIFRLGSGHSQEAARDLARRLRIPGSARAALAKIREFWDHTLGAIRIETPDAGLNALANGWLVYQTLACRFWARSGYYQSGGAFGFRDQLQDTMALVHAQPALVRSHLLLSAARQFPEGDVQHWWHPPAGRGVRTRCSDDYLWLPLAVSRYVTTTGDTGVLDEAIAFLSGRPLGPDEESYFDLPGISSDRASLYQHCVLAIRHGLRMGERGLPLMGSGDWNDGMNLVGIHGKGESVWLGFFLHRVLIDFAEIAGLHADSQFAEFCRAQARALRQSLERHAWDGAWYRRAWFDDGTPLGSSSNTECTIDSIAQSWSVLSGAGDPARSRIALDSLDKHLVRRDTGIVQLLDPPFDKSTLNPGYIKGYVPGVRENGGQYTHAAIWAAMAFAASGDSERAWELLALINPVNHGLTAAAVSVYKTEPYVVAADVYAIPPHTGRGGWSWYTGSAGWLYRLIVESLLGIARKGDVLQLTPSLPSEWQGCKVHYRHGTTLYHIDVARIDGPGGLTLDGEKQPAWSIALRDDQLDHQVHISVPH